MCHIYAFPKSSYFRLEAFGFIHKTQGVPSVKTQETNSAASRRNWQCPKKTLKPPKRGFFLVCLWVGYPLPWRTLVHRFWNENARSAIRLGKNKTFWLFHKNAKTNRQVRRCVGANQSPRAHPDWIRHYWIANSVWSIANKSYCRMVCGDPLSPFDPLPHWPRPLKAKGPSLPYKPIAIFQHNRRM